MTHLEKKLVGTLFWLTHVPSKESQDHAIEVLKLVELNQVAGGASRFETCPAPKPNN